MYTDCSFCTSAARAQVDLLPFERLSAVHLTAAQPGARALVLAGAGIGLTDDASGTVLNPATLRFLVRGEVNGGLVMTFPTAPFISNTSLRSNFTASDLTFRDEDLDPTANIFFAIAYPAARFSWAAFARIAASPNEVPTAGRSKKGEDWAAVSWLPPSRPGTVNTAPRRPSRSARTPQQA